MVAFLCRELAFLLAAAWVLGLECRGCRQACGLLESVDPSVPGLRSAAQGGLQVTHPPFHATRTVSRWKWSANHKPYWVMTSIFLKCRFGYTSGNSAQNSHKEHVKDLHELLSEYHCSRTIASTGFTVGQRFTGSLLNFHCYRKLFFDFFILAGLRNKSDWLVEKHICNSK